MSHFNLDSEISWIFFGSKERNVSKKRRVRFQYIMLIDIRDIFSFELNWNKKIPCNILDYIHIRCAIWQMEV